MIKKKFYKFDKDKMEFYPIRLNVLTVVLFFLITGIGAGIGTKYTLNNSYVNFTPLEQEQLVLLLNDSEKKTFKPRMVYEYLIERRAPFPEILYAQALLESNHFKSALFITNNNCFGMREPGRRVTMSGGAAYGYASFNSWKDCVIDRLFYNSLYLKEIKTQDMYYEYLGKSGYAEDPNYIPKIKILVKQIERGEL